MNRNDYDYFKSLHDQENPLMLYNCWDVASAKAIEKAGSKAIATSSFAMADAWGYSDGEQLSFEQLLWSVSRIAEHVSVPLTVDIEGGYAVNEEPLANNIEQLFQLDICGINFEDQKVNHPNDELWAIEEQSHRIRTIQQVAAKLQKSVFINARTDLFFKNGKHSLDLVNEAIERTSAYAAAGADGIFIPGLTDRNLIEYFVQQSPLPVNVMVMDGMISNVELQDLGVKTTGIMCRPTCPAKRPYKENCEFFPTAKEALLASYRPCKRCQPLSNPTKKSHSVLGSCRFNRGPERGLVGRISWRKTSGIQVYGARKRNFSCSCNVE